MSQTQAPVIRSIDVPVSVDRAFTAFTAGLTTWWPRAFTFGEDRYVRAGVDPEVGGQWYEVDVDGARTSWGDVLTWEPPRRLVVTWQISPQRTPEPNADHASTVEVCFEPLGDAQTRVEVRHTDFERHGDGAEKMRAGMASAQGWDGLLATYAAHLLQRGEGR